MAYFRGVAYEWQARSLPPRTAERGPLMVRAYRAFDESLQVADWGFPSGLRAHAMTMLERLRDRLQPAERVAHQPTRLPLGDVDDWAFTFEGT